MATMEEHLNFPFSLSIGTGSLLAPDARSPKHVGLDEPVSLLTSPQVTPAAHGFLPLTREVTPLHSAFRPSTGALDVNAAIQRLAHQMGKATGVGVIGEECPDFPTSSKPGAGGGDANADWDPLTSPAFVFRGAADEGRAVLPGVAEEAPAVVPVPLCGDPLGGESDRPEAPSQLGAEENSLLRTLTPLADPFGAKYLNPKDELCATFMNTPESTPLHIGFLSSFSDGQRFRTDGLGQLPSLAVPPPGACCMQEDVPSAGSAGHPLLCARPCKYAGKPRGCKDGRLCTRCHLCSWRRVAERQAGSQRAPLAAAAIGAAVG